MDCLVFESEQRFHEKINVFFVLGIEYFNSSSAPVATKDSEEVTTHKN